MPLRTREQLLEEAKKRRTLGSSIAILAREDRNFQKEHLKEYDIGTNEMAVLLQLHYFTTLCQDQLGVNLAMDCSTLSRIVKRMVCRGFITMSKNAVDGRVYDLGLTSEGEALIPVLQRNNSHWMELISRNFPLEEQQELADLLDHLLENSIHYAVPQKAGKRAPSGEKRGRGMRNSWIDAAQEAAKYRTLGSRLAVLNRIARNFFKEYFAQHKLSANDMAVLLQLEMFGELCQDDLVGNLAMDRTTLSKITKSMVERGFIYTAKNTADGRMRHLGLTQKGKGLVPFLRQGAKEWLALISEGLGEEERDRLLTMLGRMLDNGDRYAKPPFSAPGADEN